MTSSMLLYLACALTHLARVDDLRQHHGRVYAHVESWVYGPAPRPDEIPVSTVTPGAPPPPLLAESQLEAWRFEDGMWRRLAAVSASDAPRLLDMVAKRNVAGSLVHVNIAGAPGADVAVIVESQGRQVRRSSTSTGLAEFLGLAPGTYTVRAEAPGYRLWQPSSSQTLDRCAESTVVLQRYGWPEWTREQMAPVVSLVKATWMLASEYIRQ